VYIPKEWYWQEENERKVVFDMILSIGESLLFHLRNDFSYLSPMKAMAHQIEKMTALLEVDQKVNVCTWSYLTVFICSLNQYCALVSAVYRAATEVHF
jgi:hypothetical protein